MQNLPLVSIVTPAYNQAGYLAETIESVLAQDYPNIEYIVLDDGSTDSTPDVLKRYDGRIRWERHDNMGQAATLNKGWEMSRGSLMGYLSSDDRLLPSALTNLVNALQANPDVVVAYGDFSLIDMHGRTLRSVRTEDFDQRRLTVDLVCQPGAGALFRRGVFEQAGGWCERLRQVPDFEFWLRVARFGRFVRVPQVLAEYRIHDGSASFRTIAPERSMEIVQTMGNYWTDRKDRGRGRSMATAYLIATKNHAQSGRLHHALKTWSQAMLYSPSMLISIQAWRVVLSGALRRLYYRFKAAAS